MQIPKREPRPEKVEAVNVIREILNSSTVIATDYQGLSMKDSGALRTKIREAGGSMKVVKNTLLELAAKDTPAEPLTEGLAGPTALVYTDEDPVAAAKALKDFSKGPKAIKVKAGLVDGQVYNAAQMTELADIPPKEQLYAMVVGGLQSPITNLVGTMNTMIAQLVMTLQAVADQKGEAA